MSTVAVMTKSKEKEIIYDVPQTVQGLLDYIRYGKAELKRTVRHSMKLIETLNYCRQQLTMKGIDPNAKHI